MFNFRLICSHSSISSFFFFHWRPVSANSRTISSPVLLFRLLYLSSTVYFFHYYKSLDGVNLYLIWIRCIRGWALPLTGSRFFATPITGHFPVGGTDSATCTLFRNFLVVFFFFIMFCLHLRGVYILVSLFISLFFCAKILFGRIISDHPFFLRFWFV